MYCLSMTEKDEKGRKSNFTSLSLEAWRISHQRAVGFLFPAESLNIKVRLILQRREEKTCRQLHLKDIPFTLPLDGTCQWTMNSWQARRCWVLEKVRSSPLGRESRQTLWRVFSCALQSCWQLTLAPDWWSIRWGLNLGPHLRTLVKAGVQDLRLTCTRWSRRQCNKGAFNSWGACLCRTSAWATLMSHSAFCLRVLFCLSIHRGAGFELSWQYRVFSHCAPGGRIIVYYTPLCSGAGEWLLQKAGQAFPHAHPMREWKSCSLSHLLAGTWKGAAGWLCWLLQPGPVSWRCQGRNNLLKITWLPPTPFSLLPPCSPLFTVASS